jgi:hypothetical protein
MHCQSLSWLRLLLSVPLTLLGVSGHLSWTQETPSASKTSAHFASLAPQSAAVPEAGVRFNTAYGKLSLPFSSNQQVRAKFVGNPPTEWLTYSVPHNTVHHGVLDGVDALQYYGNRLPWAGRIMLGVGRQAEFHPRVFRVFELLRPALSLGKPTYPRWLGK